MTAQPVVLGPGQERQFWTSVSHGTVKVECGDNLSADDGQMVRKIWGSTTSGSSRSSAATTRTTSSGSTTPSTPRGSAGQPSPTTPNRPPGDGHATCRTSVLHASADRLRDSRRRSERRVRARLRAEGRLRIVRVRVGAGLRAGGASHAAPAALAGCGQHGQTAARPAPCRAGRGSRKPSAGRSEAFKINNLAGAHASYQRVFISGDQRAGRSRGTMRIRCRRSRLPRVVTARPITYVRDTERGSSPGPA
jgi:hypothetical protein